MASEAMRYRASIILIIVLMMQIVDLSISQAEGMPARNTADWTVLSYMSSDNDLEGYLLDDLNEMEKAAADGINIVVQIDRHADFDSSLGDWTDTRRYEVVPDDSEEIASIRLDDPELGELDMNDPEVLQEFIEWGFTNYPAENYMLILEGHADAPVSGLLKDQDSTLGYRHMKTHEMGAAVRGGIDVSVGSPIDVISLDVCWMGMAEAAAELMDHSEYFMGSVDFVPAPGWPYDICLPRIFENDADLETRLSDVVDIFHDEYTGPDGKDYISQSLFHLPSFKDHFIPTWHDLSLELFYTAYQYREIYESIIAPVDKPSQLDGTRSNDRYIDALQFAQYLVDDVRTPEKVRISASDVVEDQDSYNIHYRGGSSHSKDAKLLGIYMPEKWDAPVYSEMKIADLTPWDDLVRLHVRELDLRPVSPNWTVSRPGSLSFILRTSTPDGITRSWVEVKTSRGYENVTLLGNGGFFNGTLQLDVSGDVEYRYRIESIFGGTIDMPPDGMALLGFSGENEPPEMVHDPPITTQIGLEDGGLTFFSRDSSGILDTVPERMPRMEYWEDPLSIYSIPLVEKDRDEFTGWVEYWGLPTGMTPGEPFHYRIIIEDVLGNSAVYPDEEGWSSKMGVGGRFFLDGSRSMTDDHQLLMDSFPDLGMTLEPNMDPKGLDDLDDYKGYVIIEPTGELAMDDVQKITDFLGSGGEVMVLMDPADDLQYQSAFALLEVLDIDPTQDGAVSGFLAANPVSELGSSIPQMTGTLDGSFSLSGEQTAVYFSTPPMAVLYTDWFGKGRIIVAHSDLLDDSMMERKSTGQLADIIVTYLYQNLAPVPVLKMEPGNLVEPGEKVTFNMTGSFDRDGDISQYEVRISDGTILAGPLPTTSHVLIEPGLYSITLTLTDAEEGTNTLSTSLRVNSPPSTDHSISVPKAHAGEEISFNYKGHDPEGDSFLVEWDFGDGYKVTGTNVHHFYRTKGEFMYTLRIVDIWGLENQRTGVIVIENSDPVIEIDRNLILVNGEEGKFSGDLRLTLFLYEGDILEIDAGGSYDPDPFDILEYSWTMGDGSVLNGSEIEHAYTISGLMNLELSLTDGFGGESIYILPVMVRNRDPFAAFDWSDDDGSVTFNGSLSTDDEWDLEGLTYYWDFGDGNELTTDDPMVRHDYRFGGSYMVVLEVTDQDGASSTFKKEIEAGGMRVWTFVLLMICLALVVVAIGGFLYYRRRAASLSHDQEQEAEAEDTRPRRIRSFSRPEPFRPDNPGIGEKDGVSTGEDRRWR